MAKDQLVGTWLLVSFEIRSDDGGVSYPFGPDAGGQIIYSADGYMSGVVTRANRPRFASDDLRGGTTDEKAAAMDTYLSYGGRYEIRDDTVIHYVAFSLFPNWVGGTQERLFAFEGERLTLSAPPVVSRGKTKTVVITWKRASGETAT